MDYKELTKKERFLILDLAELAMGGDKGALENFREMTGASIKTVGDIYRIMGDVHRPMSKGERDEDHGRIKQRMVGPVPIKPQLDWGGCRPGSGRPSLPEEEVKKTRSIKFSDTEWEALKDTAAEQGVSVSEYIRGKVL